MRAGINNPNCLIADVPLIAFTSYAVAVKVMVDPAVIVGVFGEIVMRLMVPWTTVIGVVAEKPGTVAVIVHVPAVAGV